MVTEFPKSITNRTAWFQIYYRKVIDETWLFLDGRLHSPTRPVPRSQYFFIVFFFFLILLVSNDFCFVYVLLMGNFLTFDCFPCILECCFSFSLLSIVWACVCVGGGCIQFCARKQRLCCPVFMSRESVLTRFFILLF